MVEAGWYALTLYYAPQIGLHELILVIQLMEIMRRVYTRQPRRHLFLQRLDVSSCRKPYHTPARPLRERTHCS